MEATKLADTKLLVQTKWNNYCTKEQCLKRKGILGAIIFFNLILIVIIGVAVYYSGTVVIKCRRPEFKFPVKIDMAFPQMMI